MKRKIKIVPIRNARFLIVKNNLIRSINETEAIKWQ